MGIVRLEITQSLDGFVAGPQAGQEHPLGIGGEELHDWVFRLEAWRAAHGREGGEAGPESDMIREGIESQGAVVMGRRMFSGGEGPWEDDSKASGWWGDEPPFGVPVFVVTHHERDDLVLGKTTFSYVTDGPEAALGRAKEAAGDREVRVAGGGSIARQLVYAGMVDELDIHVAPMLLGDGVRLFEPRDADVVKLELVQSFSGPLATHLRYRPAE